MKNASFKLCNAISLLKCDTVKMIVEDYPLVYSCLVRILQEKDEELVKCGLKASKIIFQIDKSLF